jgi:hypothetical protein
LHEGKMAAYSTNAVQRMQMLCLHM